MFKILVIDDDPTVRAVLKSTLKKQGYDVTVASNGEEGITQAQLLHPALIICDWMMSQLDGLEVCRRIRSAPELATTFFILLTARGAARGEEDDRVRGLDAGADEFISKPIEMNELKARVRAGLRLYQLNQDLQSKKQALEELNQDLRTQKQILETELAQAADYVRSLLPSPLVGTVTTENLFIPSAQLGGDSFGHNWIDDDRLAIYLLDVSGHGVGSALLSVSVLNVLRSQSLPNTNFSQPSEVLKALNHAFQMRKHGDKYFTIWYGVYHRLKRQLIYANAGHPPALLLSSNSIANIEIQQLNSLDLPIGFLPDIEFENAVLEVKENSNLYIFSDGAYEINQPDGKILGLDAFISKLMKYSQTDICNLNQLLTNILGFNAQDNLNDDLSLVKVNFG
ncbi:MULTISPECIES: PP2C family protein-serine/threonine phosphatase [Nostoc]|uniref:SpoIIE family protein phosphatase n=1 Tax=Nostoc paludosum FACHB-159 TaxID=2692908 RepID=A0ABR8KEI6_9NOSO|nr:MULTISPECIES: SpoIIE family protein phosphatase [Nostoc]MBD2681376.1 SpoIIE family protein phosphatase [Nostoc sp. FACHB-857]MBD2737139.1 SpoIIE family protein phosphatase [Nostoc paludosum FACHB-159]